ASFRARYRAAPGPPPGLLTALYFSTYHHHPENPMKRSTIVTFCLLLAGTLPLPCSAAVDPASPTLKRFGEMATVIPDIRSLPLDEPTIVDEGIWSPRSSGPDRWASGRPETPGRYLRPLQASAGRAAPAG